MTDAEIRATLKWIRRWGPWVAIGFGAELVDATLLAVVAITYALFQDRPGS
jgi:hypothetical protein